MNNSQLPTPNSQLPTPNSQLPTSNFQLPTPNFQLPTSNFPCRKSSTTAWPVRQRPAAEERRRAVAHQRARYIITEPLYVLDVRNWKQYALFEALQIPNYTTIKAISRDSKRLVISRKDCAMDCPRAREEYYELTMP